MKNLGEIIDNEDIVTKEYVDLSTVIDSEYNANTDTVTLIIGSTSDTEESDIWEYSMSDMRGYLSGNYANSTGANERLIVLKQNNRTSYGLNEGFIPLREGTDGTYPWGSYTEIVPPFYPIPIPAKATKLVISVVPSTASVQCDLCTLNYEMGGYIRNVDTGWTKGEKTVTFNAGQYTHCAPKTNAANPEDITLQFFSE